MKRAKKLGKYFLNTVFLIVIAVPLEKTFVYINRLLYQDPEITDVFPILCCYFISTVMTWVILSLAVSIPYALIYLATKIKKLGEYFLNKVFLIFIAITVNLVIKIFVYNYRLFARDPEMTESIFAILCCYFISTVMTWAILSLGLTIIGFPFFLWYYALCPDFGQTSLKKYRIKK